MLDSRKPVISVCAVRTGAGKSPAGRRIVAWLRERDLRVAIVRHPMPYGDLSAQRVQRFATLDDQPVVRVRYELQELGRPTLSDALAGRFDALRPRG